MHRADLPDVVVKALDELGGTGTVVEVAKLIWRDHEDELRASGDLFFTWQYETRWAAQRLRDLGKLSYGRRGGKGVWQLKK
ncbi:hypothetical protein [Phreatobacter oligotrophus]|jgi:hypothetical protein|uniref:Mrr restriction endonuclease-like protein n=1 Tax=Phreatobacter oligotrophus TaxID=1122261 RepID=A0A2T4Z598_9HYPH|nr:hypothetical protein [Phreatobacter oligotrophus]PTM57036.1 hypothetical protein C8P69_10483 [Phreatobacter oligotrophus]